MRQPAAFAPHLHAVSDVATTLAQGGSSSLQASQGGLAGAALLGGASLGSADPHFGVDLGLIDLSTSNPPHKKKRESHKKCPCLVVPLINVTLPVRHDPETHFWRPGASGQHCISQQRQRPGQPPPQPQPLQVLSSSPKSL